MYDILNFDKLSKWTTTELDNSLASYKTHWLGGLDKSLVFIIFEVKFQNLILLLIS